MLLAALNRPGLHPGYSAGKKSVRTAHQVQHAIVPYSP